ncbi:BrnT family toxin [Geomonas terrae]|uniref:BrnT family toxin n=1 Tax=Geomonas terrae TaxID=2562681 RepID=A0A4S1CKB8_9BACT|nr:BrnT family toxin [Geomonas terrae]TGU74145.1 BrnT family toxin [Geomonas terrae]
MNLEWDDAKNESNIRKHGFDFADARSVIFGSLPFYARLDIRVDYGEDRWQGIGMLDGTVVVVIIFTEPRTNVVRIISMRKGTKEERKLYEKRIKN